MLSVESLHIIRLQGFLSMSQRFLDDHGARRAHIAGAKLLHPGNSMISTQSTQACTFFEGTTDTKREEHHPSRPAHRQHFCAVASGAISLKKISDFGIVKQLLLCGRSSDNQDRARI
ncbi:MAG: hypothetical protein R3A52_06815 [Polyangiales bacterium]